MYCKTKLCKKKIQVKCHGVISPLIHYIELRLFDYVYLTAYEMAITNIPIIQGHGQVHVNGRCLQIYEIQDINH